MVLRPQGLLFFLGCLLRVRSPVGLGAWFCGCAGYWFGRSCQSLPGSSAGVRSGFASLGVSQTSGSAVLQGLSGLGSVQVPAGATAGVRSGGVGSSSWLSSDVNAGASTSSGLGAGGGLGLVDGEVGSLDGEGDGDSVAAEPANESLKFVLRLMFQLFPEARSQEASAPAKSCSYERFYAHEERPVKEQVSANLFHRVAEVLKESWSKFQEVSEAGRTPVAGLAKRRRTFSVADCADLSRTATSNPGLSRILPQLSSKRSLNLSLDDTVKVEALLKAGLEAQSMSFW